MRCTQTLTFAHGIAHYINPVVQFQMSIGQCSAAAAAAAATANVFILIQQRVQAVTVSRHFHWNHYRRSLTASCLRTCGSCV
jgi:hypothetical protein